MNPLGCEVVGASNVIHVVGIAPVDEDIPLLDMGQEVGDAAVHDGRRDHQPDGARFLQLFHEIRERRGPHGFLRSQLLDRLGFPVEDHTLMASFEKPAHHVGAHSTQSDHSQLHSDLLTDPLNSLGLQAYLPRGGEKCRLSEVSNRRARKEKVDVFIDFDRVP